MSYTPPLDAEFTAFQTTNPLLNGQSFDSGALDADGITQVQTEIEASHDGTINISFCQDAAGLNVVRSLSIPYRASDGYQFFAAPAFVNFIKYEFTNNSGVDQTDFYYTTKFLRTALSPQLLTTGAFIAPSMVTTLNRTIIVGQNDGGRFENVKVDNLKHLQVNSSNPKTAYDEIPMAELTPVIQLTYSYNVNADLNTITEVDGGTVTQADNMAIVQSGTLATGQAALTSKRTIPFRAGQGVLTRFDAVFTNNAPNDANSRQGIGIGDANDGYGFTYIGNDFAIGYRTNGVQTNILQANWNIDNLDGSGSSDNPSGILLDPTKGNVYQIVYGSGFGNVKFSIESQDTGDMILVHVVEYSNKFALPSAYNPIFPMSTEVATGGSTTNLTVKVGMMSAFIEGKNEPTGALNSFENQKNIGGTETSIFSLQNKSTFAGKTNKINAILRSISTVNDTNGVGFFRLWENATLGGTPNYIDINTNTSVIAADTAGTTRTGGKLLWSASVGKDAGNTIDLKALEITLRPNNTYTLTAEGGSTATMAASLVWVEDF